MTGFVCAFFATGHRLCLDLAHLVDGRGGPCRRLRDLRGVRLARPRRIRHSSSRSCSHCTAPTLRSGAPSPATQGARDGRRHTRISTRRPRRQRYIGRSAHRARPQTDRHRLWLLDLHQRIWSRSRAFFATYAVPLHQTAGGPSGRELFNLRNVAIETGFLLASSFTCAANRRHSQPDLVSNSHGGHLRIRVALRSREGNLWVARGAGLLYRRRSLRWWVAMDCTSAGELGC